MSRPINLFCIVHDDPDAVPFSVNADKEDTISVLKEYIKKKKKPEFDSFASDRLKLWKWNKSTDSVGELNINNVLDPRRTISDVFKGDPPRKGRTQIVLKVPTSISPSSSESSVAAYNTLKRQHLPDYSDNTKRLKFDDTFDDLFTGFMSLWDSAWGKTSETTFEVRTVDRDGTLPDVHTPRTCMVLNLPNNLLEPFFISSILIRQEYIIALKFAILIAQGGRPSAFKHHRKNANCTLEDDELLLKSENESNLDPAMELNPFASSNSLDQAGAVTFLGHPGIGKTVFLFYILVCRMLASLPSVYMDKPDCVYIIDSSGVRRLDIRAVNRASITKRHWCLVDSNAQLESVPEKISSLGTFIIQSALPRNKRDQWWKKYSPAVRRFIMKEWSLPELIMGRTLQMANKASELELRTFLDRFVPSARLAFGYAVDQKNYDRRMKENLSLLERTMIPRIVDSARTISFDYDVSHLVLITPSEENRSQHLVEIPTRYLYEQIRNLAKVQALDGAFLIYEAFKDVNETKSAAGYIYEDFTRHLLPLGGQWPVVSMKKEPKKRKFLHWKTTGTEKADGYLWIGRSGGPPFEFATTPLTDDAIFNKLKCMGFRKDERLRLEDGFYFPLVKTRAIFDAFVYHAETRTATVLQVTVSGERHSENNTGFEWLESLGVEKVYYVGITPVGASLDLPFDPVWEDSFVAKVYHLPMDPVRPKQH